MRITKKIFSLILLSGFILYAQTDLPTPVLQVIPGDQQVKLIWDRSAETIPGFEGYRIYKSVDNGYTWGIPITNVTGDTIAYKPLEIFDLVNGIKGAHPLLPGFSLGQDAGIETLHSVIDGDTMNVYTDTQVKNGFNYVYVVCAYTSGSSEEIPVENAFPTDPNVAGDNSVETTPNAPVNTIDLIDVKVVPNPYKVASEWETQGGEKRIDFTNLPESGTICIYNLGAELVKVIEHNSGSTVSWNLQSDYGKEVAAGLYFYYMESTLGVAKGKFLLIK